MIVLRMTHFMKKDDFEKEKKEWEEENPGTLVIPCTMEAVNPKRGKWLKSDIPCEEWKCSACGGGAWECEYINRAEAIEVMRKYKAYEKVKAVTVETKIGE